MNIKSLLITAGLALLAIPAMADPVVVTNATDAFKATLGFLNLNPQAIAVVLLVIHVIAKYIRNYGIPHVTKDQANILHKIVALLSALPLDPTPVKASCPKTQP